MTCSAAVLGWPQYQGVLGSDFYAAYNIHQGLHQRCRVHFLRDGHELKEQETARTQQQRALEREL